MRIHCLIFALSLSHTASASESTEPARILAEAHQFIRAQDWERADQRLETTLPGAWNGHKNALLGITHLHRDRAVDAVQSLQSALASSNIRAPLRNQAQLHLGQALLQIEDADGAWEVLLDLLETDQLGSRSRLPKPDDVDPAEIRWKLSQVAIAQGRTNEAARQWEALWTQNPTSPLSERAEKALNDADVPITATDQRGRDLITNRIRSLEKLYRTREALALREQLPADHRLLEAHRFAGAVFKAKDYERATTLLANLPDRSQDEGILLALAQVRSGDPESSMRTYRQLAKGSGPVAELAQYKLGYMSWDQGLWSDAVEDFSAYLTKYPNGKHADTSLWFTAMAQMRFGAKAQARNTLERLRAEHPRSSLRVGAAYWSARLHPNPSVRQEQLARVVQQWPTTGYAWFASHALGQTFEQKQPDESKQDTTLFDDSDWRIGIQLAEVGLETWARPHLESLISQAKQAGKDHRLALAKALIEAGSYQAAKRLAQPWCPRPAKAIDPRLTSVCWPQPSQTTVVPLAEQSGLPGHLPFAIMTAESALDPSVTSPAGARGLMQLMPKLAAEIANEKWPQKPFHPDFLFRASTNAELGTTELSRLSKRFEQAEIDNTLPLVIAGYNGGPEAVERWMSSWGTPPRADEWSEFIGYSETRKYVRRVLGYLQTYRLAYGDNQPDQASESKTDGSNTSGSPAQE